MVKIILFFVLLIQVCVCDNISDAEYSLMPSVFYMDNYDDCMLVKNKSLFCSFSYQLEPIDKNNASDVWKIINEVSSDVSNYRHDILRHYICLRKSCPTASFKPNEIELKQEIKKCYDEKYHNLGVNGTIYGLKCFTSNSSYPISYFDIILALILTIYVIFVIIATMCEKQARHKSKEEYIQFASTKSGKFLSAFSLRRNWQRLTLINPNTPSDIRKLRSIQGIRFFTMTGVILSHTQIFHSRGPVRNPKYMETVTKHIQNMVLVNSSCVIQIYFLISSWLLTYHFFQLFDKHPKVQPKLLIFAIVNRIIRLLPSMAVAIALKATWLPHMGDGPLWDDIVEQSTDCKKNWWVNLLFINNMIKTDDMCSRELWYLAADMQLFLLALIVLTIIWKYRNKVVYIFWFCHIVSYAIPAYVAYSNDYDILHRQYPENLYNDKGLKGEIYLRMYASAYSNASGWMIGMTFGYLFYIYKDKKLFTKKIYVLLWLIISWGACLFQIFSGYIFYRDSSKQSAVLSALYWASMKPLYAFGIATLIFGFTQDIGWFLKWFFEWHVLEICGRLSYSIYVTHSLFILFRGGLRRSPFYSIDTLNMYYVLGDLCMSVIGGLVLCLFVEMPISAVQKGLLPQLADQRSNRDAEEIKNKNQ